MVLNASSGAKTATSLQEKPTVTLSANSNKVTVKYGSSETTVDINNIEFENASAGERIIVTCGPHKVILPLSKIKQIFTEAYNEDNFDNLAKVIAANPDVSLYSQAIKATGLADSIKHYYDVTYTIDTDSTNWDNDDLCIFTGTEYDNVAYSKERKYNFTALLVTDKVLAEKYGITTLTQLEAKAHEIYDEVYPEDKNISDRTSRRNALNRFISYHILPFAGEYYKLTAVDGENSKLAALFDRKNIDITEWYETLMPNSIIKFSFPSGEEEGLYVNRRGIEAHEDAQGVFVRGARLSAPNQMTIGNTASNGIFHYIDDIIAYGKTTQQKICNDRMRISATTLSPDFIRSGARGHKSKSSIDNGMYGYGCMTNKAEANESTCLGFKSGFTDNFSFEDSDTHIHVRNRYLQFWNYQGESLALIGKYDATIKLPTLPAGEYELRILTVSGFTATGDINFSIANQIDKTLNFVNSGEAVGYKDDQKLVDEFRRYVNDNYDVLLDTGKDKFTAEELTPDVAKLYPCNCTETTTDSEGNASTTSYYSPVIDFDKKWKAETGLMKGPASYHPGSINSSSMRDHDTYRHVVGTFTSDGKSDIKLRIKDANPTGGRFLLDFIEIVPVNFENEDIY